jgi:hypothetical protein
MLVTLNLTARHLRIILFTIIILNVLLLAGAAVFNTSYKSLPEIFREADLASENIFAAWYSSMLLFLCGAMSFVCFLSDQQHAHKNRLLNFGWLILTLIFLLLSFDELGSVHEYIGNFAGFESAGKLVSDSKEPGWIFFYLLVAAVSIFMLLFGIMRLRRSKYSLVFFVMALLLYMSNPFQEYLEIASMRAAASEDEWKRPVYLLLLEEGSELFGSLFFLIAVTCYAVRSSATKDLMFKMQVARSALLRFVAGVVLAMAICLLFLDVQFGDVRGDLQNGVPKNWITASMAFSISLYMILQYNAHKQNRAYVLFSIFSLFISVYYGSNRFAFYFDKEYTTSRILFRSLICLFGMIAYFNLYKMADTKVARTVTILSLLLLIVGIFAKRPYSAEVSFISLGLLVLAFFPGKVNS